jgi:hypothetical protein
MPIDMNLILRFAGDVQRLELDVSRAVELAEEAKALCESALVAGERAEFDDDPDRFAGLLWQLRDPF